jgi:hypothetical protein
MSFPLQSLQRRAFHGVRVAVGLIIAFAFVAVTLVGSAHAAQTSSSDTYIAPDGVDLTEVATCIPDELSNGDLGRALDKSTNEFLEKVFNLKDSYADYELDETETEFLQCLERKGITPQVEQIVD